MKLLLKLVLFLSIVVVVIYATTPLWMPLVLARQLPVVAFKVVSPKQDNVKFSIAPASLKVVG
jgi:hypothetical protein